MLLKHLAFQTHSCVIQIKFAITYYFCPQPRHQSVGIEL